MIDYGKDRNSDNHSDESEKAAEKHNCEQYPEAVEVSHLTKNFRTKYVAVSYTHLDVYKRQALLQMKRQDLRQEMAYLPEEMQ